MKILYVSQYFPPEMGAPAARASELTFHWAHSGHDVSVLTGFPNHPTGVVPHEWRSRLRHLTCRETINGVTIYRTWLWPLPNRKAHERMRNYASFCISAALRGMTIPRPDVIIASSPQLLVGLSGLWLALLREIPFVFEVRDLWPESLAAVGAGDEHSLLHTALAMVARLLYGRSNHIVVVTPSFKQHIIQNWHIPAEKISVVENGVETSLFAPIDPSSRNSIRQDLAAESRFLVCYIGTMGMAHGLETLLAAAAKLQVENARVLFLLVGEGAEKQRIQAEAKSRGLTNVRFLDQQPREKIPALISAADACLVLLKKTDIFKTVIPTKLLEFMSCERPVILGVEGLARQIVEEAQAGIPIEPENAVALAEAVNHLAANPDLAHGLGQRGRQYILKNFSRAYTAEKYVGVLGKVTGKIASQRPETI